MLNFNNLALLPPAGIFVAFKNMDINHLNIFFMKTLLTFAIALLLSVPCFSQIQSPKIALDTPTEQFLAKLDKITPLMKKEAVLPILGNPYKTSMIKTIDGDVYEALSYRTYVYKRTRTTTVIVYSMVFRNSKLIMIDEEEEIADGGHAKISGVDLWAIAKNYLEIKYQP